MTNLYEMMLGAQNGQAMRNLAVQFGLNQQQTQAAIEALLPAFSMGLRRQTQDPYAFGNLAQLMSASPFGRLYDSSGGGIPDNAAAVGTTVLAQIFGSPEVSRAVAEQAAATTGVSQAILKQMLPVIAAMIMGGLTKSVSSQGLGGLFGQFAEMMQGRFPGAQQAPTPANNPASPFDAILGGLFGNAQSSTPGHTQGGGPFGGGRVPDQQAGSDAMNGGLLGQILAGMLGATPAGGEAQPPGGAEGRAAGPAADSLGLDALNQMFESGRKVQEEHQNALQSIFDAMLKGQSRGG